MNLQRPRPVRARATMAAYYERGDYGALLMLLSIFVLACVAACVYGLARAPLPSSSPSTSSLPSSSSGARLSARLGSKSAASAAGGHAVMGTSAALVALDLSAPAVNISTCLNGSMTNGSDVLCDGRAPGESITAKTGPPLHISGHCAAADCPLKAATTLRSPTLKQMKKKKKNRADKLRKRAARAVGAAVTDATLDTMAPLVTPCSQPGAL